MEKEEKYQLLARQVAALTEGEDDAISVMANVCAAIHEQMGAFSGLASIASVAVSCAWVRSRGQWPALA